MRKTIGLMLGVALLGSAAQASAQEAKTASARPGYIGVRYDDHYEVLMPASRRDNKIVIRDISKDSPAAKAGLKTGDEILSINGLSSANGKFSAVARTLVEGDTVKLRIKRGDVVRDFTLVAAQRPAGSYTTLLGDRTIVFSADSVRGLAKLWMDSALVHLDSMKLPRVFIHPGDSGVDIRIHKWRGMPGDTLIFRRDSLAMRELGERFGPMFERHLEGDLGPGVVFRSMELGSRSIAGAEFTDLDPAMKTYFGTDRGLLTLRVAPETPAARAGLQPGDIVLKANGREMSHVAGLRNMLFHESGTIKLEVLRKGDNKTLEIKTRSKGSDE